MRLQVLWTYKWIDCGDASLKTSYREVVGQLRGLPLIYLNEFTWRQQQEESAEEHELLLHHLALEHDEDMLEEPEEDEDYFIIIDGETSSDDDDEPIFLPLFD